MRRILAILCIVVLVVSVMVMLAAAIFNFPYASQIFIGALAVNVLLPVLIWVILQTGEYLKRKGEKIRDEENE